MHILNKKNNDWIFFSYILIEFFFLTNSIKNNKIENEKKFTNVKLYGEKLNIVNAPSKKGIKIITINLLFNRIGNLKFLLSFK